MTDFLAKTLSVPLGLGADELVQIRLAIGRILSENFKDSPRTFVAMRVYDDGRGVLRFRGLTNLNYRYEVRVEGDRAFLVSRTPYKKNRGGKNVPRSQG